MTGSVFSVSTISATVLYALLGAFMLFAVGWAIDQMIRRYDLWDEIVIKKNVALAILAAGFLIALGQIIAAVVH